MTPEELKLQIDTDITNKTSARSITPTNVGKNMKDVVDFIPDITSKENISNKSINIVTDATSDIKYPSVKAVNDGLTLKVDKVTGKSLVLDTEITKLSHLNDTTDMQKPVSTAQQAALDNLETLLQSDIQAQLVDSTLINGVTTSSSVPPTGNIHAIGVGPGTYPNWGGMVIPANNIGTLQRVNSVYSVSLTPIAIPDNGITPWTATSFASGKQVNYLGKDWVGNINPESWDVPGSSAKWVERLTAYQNKTDARSKFVTFTTDKATTRLLILESERSHGFIINYKIGSSWVAERYTGLYLDDTSWPNDRNWSPISNGNGEQIVFTGGVFYFEPIKSGDTYVEGQLWQVRVAKTLTTKNKSNFADESLVTIPIGTYPLPAKTIADTFLYWDNVNKSFTKTRTNNSDTLLVGMAQYNNSTYDNITNIKGFVAAYVYDGGILNLTNSNCFFDEEVTLNNILIDGDDIKKYLGVFQGVKKYNLLAGEYKASSLYVNNTRDFVVAINGAGSTTIIKGWDFTLNVEKINLWDVMVDNVKYSNLTIRNLGFQQYGGESVLKYGRSFELENVNHVMTLNSPGGYINYLITEGLNVTFKNYHISVADGLNVYAGIYHENVSLNVDNCSVVGITGKPFACFSILPSTINRVYVNKGTTGIFFGANKIRPLRNIVLTNCLVENAEEESISFDCFGNNVALNPMIAELSLRSPTLITENIGDYTRQKMKVYCDSRKLQGTHPNEVYVADSFIGRESYIKQFYVVFSELAGTEFAGTIAKIIEVGSDANGEFLILNCAMNPTGLTLLANTTLGGVENNYQVASVMSGFYDCTIRGNVVRGGYETGFAMYSAFFNNVFEGNKSENCASGSYIWSGRMLATGVWNASNGNIIANNIFDGGNLNGTRKGFKFEKYGEILGHNNVFVNNIITNNNGLKVMNEDNLILSNNIIAGTTATLSLSGITNTDEFGTKYPKAPKPGQEFFDTTLSLKKRWTGSSWITI